MTNVTLRGNGRFFQYSAPMVSAILGDALPHPAAQPIVNRSLHQGMHFLGKESGIEALVDPARYVRPFAAVKTSAAAPYDAAAFDGEFDLVLDIAPRLGPMGSFQHVALPVERESYCGAAMSRNSKRKHQRPYRDFPGPGQEDE